MELSKTVEKMANETFERGSLNGAWLYAEKGEIVFKGAKGFQDPEGKKPLTEETVFQLASVSKQFTAAAVMLVIRKGLLSLEDEITKFFPEIPYPGVTVRHLLTHTGGVPDYFDDDDWFINIWKTEHRVPGNDEIVRFLCESKLKPLFKPGEKFEYSNTGYNLLALLVERLSGVKYEEFLQKNLFGPAGMTSTRCCHIRRDGVPFENYARASVLENGKYVADIESQEEADGVISVDGLNGDDYVYTNIFDMLKWDRALRSGKILTAEEQRLMYTPARLNDGSVSGFDEGENCDGYGFGWGVADDPKLGLIVNHSGGMPGVNTWYERFIDADRVLVMLFSREPKDMRAGLGFWNGLMAIARGNEPEPIKSIEDIEIKDPDKSKWESFCGKYEKNEEEFPVDEIYMKDGELYCKVVYDEDDIHDFKLYPIGEDLFGRKRGMVGIKFGDGNLTINGKTVCKKL